jgi:hypothetical protein
MTEEQEEGTNVTRASAREAGQSLTKLGKASATGGNCLKISIDKVLASGDAPQVHVGYKASQLRLAKAGTSRG